MLAPELTAESLIEALEDGRFYSSSGVELSRIDATNGKLAVDVVPVDGASYVIQFIGTRAGYDATSEPVVDGRRKRVACDPPV